MAGSHAMRDIVRKSYGVLAHDGQPTLLTTTGTAELGHGAGYMAHLDRISKPSGFASLYGHPYTRSGMSPSDIRMSREPQQATLEPVRFGEFLRDRQLITDEQWLAALADHWSAPKRRRIGLAIVENGFLSHEAVEAEARVFHDDLDVVEVLPRSEKVTAPMHPLRF